MIASHADDSAGTITLGIRPSRVPRLTSCSYQKSWTAFVRPYANISDR